MTQYMLMFSLGPVQSFISQARKTRDLWLGSYLLSTLMLSAMQDIQSHLIYPSSLKVSGSGLPNKFVAIFDTDQQAIEAARNSATQIGEKWQELCRQVWQAIIPDNVSDETQIIWNRQINPANLFEIYWVVVAGDPNDYAQWLVATQEELNARKMLRNFPPQDEPGEKSTISGEREALHGNETSRAAVREFWKYVAAEQSAYDINKEGRERLDAVDTVKRFATKSQIIPSNMTFPSTSSIATASFVERLLRDFANSSELADWLKATDYEKMKVMRPQAIPYLNALAETDNQKKILRRDGDCFFPETFTTYRLKEDYGFGEEAEEVAKNGLAALKKLLTATTNAEIVRPRSYYAMIQMDGDRMGKLLGGVSGQGEHKAISTALSDFARGAVTEIVEKSYPGRLIYAGGDDVLALTPLARDYSRGTSPSGDLLTVLDLVERLQQQYHATVSKSVGDKDRQDNVTASTGIAIAHHYTSLSYVRRMAKGAEDRAKHFYGRNALVVTLLRRSGEQTQVGCHWEYSIERDGKEEIIRPTALFSEFYNLFKEDLLSPKLVYTLLEEASALVESGQEVQASEMRRAMQRQRGQGKEDKLPNARINTLASQLATLARAMDQDKEPSFLSKEGKSVYLHSDKRRYGLVEVLGWLLVMDFLAREEQE